MNAANPAAGAADPALLLVEQSGGVVRLTLNRPAQYNACLLYTSDAADE